MLNKYALCEDITKLKRLLVPERIILIIEIFKNNIHFTLTTQARYIINFGTK